KIHTNRRAKVSQDKCSALCRLWLVSEFENFKSRFQSQMQAFMNNRK
ncbi:hypothetical protein HMPREF1989_00010, partial [Porphyromonas gingivalis F0566]